MGGEGAMMAANQSLKTNRNMLSKRKEKGWGLVSTSTEKTEYDLPKATPRQLDEIKARLQKERQRLVVIRGVTLVIALIALVSMLIYL